MPFNYWSELYGGGRGRRRYHINNNKLDKSNRLITIKCDLFLFKCVIISSIDWVNVTRDTQFIDRHAIYEVDFYVLRFPIDWYLHAGWYDYAASWALFVIHLDSD